MNHRAFFLAPRRWLLPLVLCGALAACGGTYYKDMSASELASRGNEENVIAQYWLGWKYANGEGVAQDFSQAALWYRRAADRGDADAQNNLGVLYSNGQGVVKDKAQAVYWYRQAANNGNAQAQNNLAQDYENGTGVQRDMTQALIWYQQAATQGDADAKKSVKRLSAAAAPPPAADPAGDLNRLADAADKGDADAQYQLGMVLLQSLANKSTKADPKQVFAMGVMLLEKAAEQGHEGATAALIELHKGMQEKNRQKQ